MKHEIKSEMFDFKSSENYSSLKKFFSPGFEQLRHVLSSNQFSQIEMQKIVNELQHEFHSDFFTCLEVARAQFLPNQLLDVLLTLYNHLQDLYEPVECMIISAKELDSAAKQSLEASLGAKFGMQYKTMRYVYECDEGIVAGIIIKLGGKCYDGSFKNILFDIQSKMQEDLIK